MTVRHATDVYRFAYPDEYVHDDLQNVEKYDVPEEVREALTLEETAREISEPRMGERTDLCLRGDKGNESKHWDKEIADDLGGSRISLCLLGDEATPLFIL